MSWSARFIKEQIWAQFDISLWRTLANSWKCSVSSNSMVQHRKLTPKSPSLSSSRCFHTQIVREVRIVSNKTSSWQEVVRTISRASSFTLAILSLVRQASILWFRKQANNAGHYVSYSRVGNQVCQAHAWPTNEYCVDQIKQWLKFNNHNVTLASKSQVLNDQAFLLFYVIQSLAWSRRMVWENSLLISGHSVFCRKRSDVLRKLVRPLVYDIQLLA